ncbi:MAG: GDP-mannose 4,6-dehydratase [archaeon]
MLTREITKCRVCGSTDLVGLFGLGDLYLSTFVEKEGENIGKAPLHLVWCNNCSLVQLKHTAPQELMYSRHYWYRSNLNKVIIDDLKEITEAAQKMVPLKRDDIVLDIGANDGTLLKFYPDHLRRIGCEPALNLVPELKKHCNIVIDDFWDYNRYGYMFSDRKAKIITAIGMFYDMDDPGQFIRDSAKALAEDGVFVAQLMTSKPMLEKNDIGNICHEHLEYYSYSSLKYLFEKNGLEIFKVEENSINGGSYRVFARHYKNGSVDYPEDITKESYLELAKRMDQNKKECVDLINSILKEGKSVYAYGASTKGNTILQYYGLGKDSINGIAEIHPEKIGKMTVGTHIPILEEEEAKKKADYFLVLPYAFKDSFIKREQSWLKEGGKFIFCTPKVEIYGWGEQTLSGDSDTGGRKKKALILGVTGQDGSYMAELLLEKGYEVHGFIRRSSTGNTKNIKHLIDKINIHQGDLADSTSLYRTISSVNPDELYNFADQDHVRWSYDSVDYSSDITGAAVGRILEIIKQVNPKIKFFQPVSSNIFGKTLDGIQTEETGLRPQSPYACAKAYAFHLMRYYRDVFGLFASTAIFYNHESPRRNEEYVTRKITRAVARISKGLQDKLYLGFIDLGIDFGYSEDYVKASWNILQLTKPDDFIICTGEQHTVREFVEEAFKHIGVEILWKGDGLEQVGYDKNTGRECVGVDPRFFRPSKTDPLIGDTSKARQAFGFSPGVRFRDLVGLMVKHDLKEVDSEIKR